MSLSQDLRILIEYFDAYAKVRLSSYFHADKENLPFPEYPTFPEEGSPLAGFAKALKPQPEEWVVFVLALLPHVAPGKIEQILSAYLKSDSDFPEFGGKRTAGSRHVFPTGETALFLVAGVNIEERAKWMGLFDEVHFFSQEQIIKLEDVENGEPRFNGRLMMDSEFVELFTRGFVSPPKFSSSFPARFIHTALEWNDLVVTPEVQDRLKEMEVWIEHNHTLRAEWGMGNKIRPGYLALLYGPPGTGKTLACSLLGKYTGRSVFKVDLSSVVSKYIGETEKNLSNLFQKAENKNWILFFDEADALFGKRTNVKSSNDRFANQEVSYLLQRIETFNGLIVLASNNKANMDDAFLRRFQAIVEFAFPVEKERTEIWRKAFPPDVKFENERDIPSLAGNYELAGGSIINVVQFACLRSISRNEKIIRWSDILQGVRLEFQKEGRVFTPNS
jgi:ATPase family associated with various cellular activities (AAA)